MRVFEKLPGGSGRRAHGFDYTLMLVVIALSLGGALMVYSTSSVYAVEKYGESWRFFKLQLIYLGIGFAFMAFMAMTDYEKLRKIAIPAYCAGLLLLVAVLLAGREVSGAKRWLSVGGFSFQPSEFAKFAFFLYLADFLKRKSGVMSSFFRGVFPCLIMGGFYAGLIFMQPDFGTSFIILAVTGIMLFLGGGRFVHLSALAGGVVCFAFLAVWIEPYRWERVLGFFNTWETYHGSGYQAVQSMVAFSLGGFSGQGLGASNQKLFFLPEAHTDFILSIIGEELGFIGVALVVAGFVVFFFRSVKIAVGSPDMFGFHMAMSYALLIVFQAVVNMAVVLSLLPTKGLTLPFISYGGTSLVATLGAAGVILSVSRKGGRRA